MSNECHSSTYLSTIDYILIPDIINTKLDLQSFTEQPILYSSSGYYYNPIKTISHFKKEDIGLNDGDFIVLYNAVLILILELSYCISIL